MFGLEILKWFAFVFFLNYFKRIATFRSSPVRNFPGLFTDDWSDWSVISGI